MSCTRIAVALAADGRVRCELRAGHLSPQLTGVSGATARVSLLARTATLLGGDDVAVEVHVGPGALLLLTDVAATIAYSGRGASARWSARIEVGAGGRLLWHGEHLVVSDGADVVRTLSADVADGGRLLLREPLTLGRSGQPGGHLRCRTRIDHAGGPALAEDLELDGTLRGAPGVLGTGHPGGDAPPAPATLESVTAVGWRPEPHPDDAFRLALPGALHRRIMTGAHHPGSAEVWTAWSQDLTLPG